MKKQLWKSLGCSLLALVLVLSMMVWVVPTDVSAAKSDDLKAELDELEAQNDELQDKIDGLEDQKSENLSEIQQLVNTKTAIDQQIALLFAQVSNINSQLAAYNQLIADKQDELDQAQARLAELNAQNRDRIRAMEMEGTFSYWSVLFKATSFSDLLDRLNMIQQIAEADKRRIEEMNTVAAEIAAVQVELTAEKAALEDTKAELALTQADLDVKRVEADELLTELIARGEEFQALIDESEDLQADLMQQIADKEKEYNDAKKEEEEANKPPVGSGGDGGGGASAPNVGGWIIPCSYVYVSSPFNPGRLHPILGYVRPHNGIDLAAYLGTPVYATRAGTVTTVDYQASGAGNYVSINHGDGFSSIYMHLDSYVAYAGQYVQAGQLIGYVGTSGLSQGPHLHFGISYNGTYVDPANYMDF